MQAPEPDVQTIRLHKSNNGMGLSIAAAKVSYCVLYDLQFRVVLSFFLFGNFFQGAGQERLGIYIKSVVKGGAADAVSVINNNTVNLILIHR